MTTRYRITGYNGTADTVITRPRSLKGAAARLQKDGKNWRRWGWDDIFLEVDTGSGWRQIRRDEVPARAELGNDLRAELFGQAAR
jgi:hypothetical protein